MTKRKALYLTATLVALVVLGLLLGCGTMGAMEMSKENPNIVTFIETSDIHGAIFPYNFITDRPNPTSQAQVYALVKQERLNEKQGVVLLDNGDVLQGQPTVYYYNFENTKSQHIVSQVMNYMGYDAMTMGNHDIEAGHPVYDKLIKEMNFPVLAANAVKDDGTPYFTPYIIINKKGVKIAVLGLITPKIPSWLPSQFWSGMHFEDMVVSAQKWIKIIQDKEKPDLIVGLFHSGVDYTYGGSNADTPENENASQVVAQKVAGFDFIFVGHDHAGWAGPGLNGKDVKDPNGKTVPIFGSLNAARKIPIVSVSIEWDKASSTWKKTIVGNLVDMTPVQADTEFMSKFSPQFDEVKAYVSRPIGKMVGKITTRDSMFGDSAFVDLIHAIQLAITGDPAFGLNKTQISFAAPLAFDATVPSSADGTLFVRDMFNLYVYENFLYTMNLTGKQIDDFLEYSYGLWLNTMTSPTDHLIAFKLDDKGALVFDNRTNAVKTKDLYYNYDSAAGIKYTVDISKPIGQRVTIISMADGSAFDMNKVYSVAINSYRAQGGGGHLTKGSGIPAADLISYKLVTSATIKDLRYYLMKWIEGQKGPITPTAFGNWTIIPDDLYQAGKATDFPILFPPPAK